MSAPNKLPTYSIEDERAVLGALLSDNRILGRLDSLSEGDFYGPRNSRIFGAVTRLIASGGHADVLTVRAELASGDEDADRETLDDLVELISAVPSASNARAYAAAIRKHASRRAVIEAADAALEAAWTEPDLGLAIDAITSKFGELERGQIADAPLSIAAIALECLDHSTALQRGEVAAGWSTGLQWLDRSLSGGLKGGGLYILAARPSVGKSSFAESIGLATAAAGLATLFLSMEMGTREVAQRGVANVGRVSYSALQTGTMDVESWNRAVEALEQMGALPLSIDATPALSLRQVRAKAKSIKGLKVLIVDYLQLMASTRRDGNRNGEIEEISRGLKSLAKELDIAVVALSQLNRDVEKRATKQPMLSDLRDSGAIEQDADAVMFLWPVRSPDAEGRNVVGLGVAKNRQGPRDVSTGLDFYGDTQRWEQSTADIRPAPAARGRGDDL